MFRPYQVIKHKNNTDVCFMVRKAIGPFGAKNKYIIKGEWWNLGFVESWPLGVPQKLELTREELSNWLFLPNDITVKCLRYANWKAIK